MHDDQPVKGVLYQAESYQIVGACFAVYNDKGCGLRVNFGHYPGLEHERILNVPDRLRRKLPADFRI